MLKGTNLEYTKAYNHRIVLESIRLHGPISRAEIARKTMLTRQTISNIVARLLEQGLVSETGLKQGRVGSPSTQLEFNALGAYAIGFDLDQSHITGLIVDLDGIIHHRIKTEVSPLPEQAIDLIVDMTERLINKLDINRNRVIGVSVGFPGPIRVNDGRVVALSGYELTKADDKNNNVSSWENIPIVEQLSQRLKLPIFLENNATAAAIGESFFGVARNMRNFFYVFLSEGIGGAIIQNNRPVQGMAGSAGELGFIPSRQDDNKRLGSFFDLASLFKTLAQKKPADYTIQNLEEELNDNNPILLDWLEHAAVELAKVLIAVEFLINPEAIVFGGLWPAALIEALLDRLEPELNNLRLPKSKAHRPLYLRAKADEEAAAHWIATLAIYSLLSPDPSLLQKQKEQSADLFVSLGRGKIA